MSKTLNEFFGAFRDDGKTVKSAEKVYRNDAGAEYASIMKGVIDLPDGFTIGKDTELEIFGRVISFKEDVTAKAIIVTSFTKEGITETRVIFKAAAAEQAEVRIDLSEDFEYPDGLAGHIFDAGADPLGAQEDGIRQLTGEKVDLFMADL